MGGSSFRPEQAIPSPGRGQNAACTEARIKVAAVDLSHKGLLGFLLLQGTDTLKGTEAKWEACFLSSSELANWSKPLQALLA